MERLHNFKLLKKRGIGLTFHNRLDLIRYTADCGPVSLNIYNILKVIIMNYII